VCTAMTDDRGVKIWIVVAVALLAALVAGTGAWVAVTAPGAAISEALLAEQSRVASLTKSAESLSGEASAAVAAADAATAEASAKAAAQAADPAPVAKSFTTLAYVTKVSGPTAGKYAVSIDPFKYLEGAAATDYAVAHGMTPPSNGLLLVNESTKATAYPLAATAKITAYNGGVESMTPQVITPVLLKEWVADHTALPEAVSDMWRVTVKSGTITTIQMIAVAD
jgi:hypothetical protein